MKKKLTAMVLALGAILGTFEAGAALAGNGTKTDPYRIGSYGDLVAFAAKVSGSSQLVQLSENGSSCQVTLYAPPKPTAKPPFAGFCKTFAVTLPLDGQNVVTDDVAVEEMSD